MNEEELRQNLQRVQAMTPEQLQQAAEGGDHVAQMKLAIDCGNTEDHTQAVKWYRLVAESSGPGSVPAQHSLGVCYDEGLGVAESPEEAVKWYRMAADAGNSRSQVNLGLCYENGRGVTSDPAEALQLYTEAAKQNSADAFLNLAWCYANGNGVPANPAEAILWWTRADEAGHPTTKNLVARAKFFALVRPTSRASRPSPSGCASVLLAVLTFGILCLVALTIVR